MSNSPADRDPPPDAEADDDESLPDDLSPVEIPITDVLDLHSFPPREVPGLVKDWLDEVCACGFRHVRIIHGRGSGVQRQTVRTILSRDPRVVAYGDAPPEGGGWGATWVEMTVEERQCED